MKFAIISDTHFGDDHCMLVTPGLEPGPRYGQFRELAGTDNDFLILAGDVLDFSIAGYEKAYGCAKVFFQQIKNDGIAREVIYLAGNHDADMWHIIQHQKSVINRLKRGKLPRQLEHSAPGILDDREGSPTRGFTLHGTSVRSGAGGSKYGGMFLDRLTDPETLFNFAYPNLYIVTDRESVLVTHGQYLESYWTLLGEIATRVAPEDLKAGAVDAEEMVELNFPLNQFACTGLGQAGILTGLVRMIELDVKNRDFKRIQRYLDRLKEEFGGMLPCGWLGKLAEKLIFRMAGNRLIDALSSSRKARYLENFVHRDEVKERFRRFIAAGFLEIEAINASVQNFRLPAPQRIIFGHTHQPVGWSNLEASLDVTHCGAAKHLTLHNTGGWLSENGKFCGAEVFSYETAKGFSSASVS